MQVILKKKHMKGCLKPGGTKHRLEEASINFVLMSPIVIVFRNSVMTNSKVELQTMQMSWITGSFCCK